MTDFIEVTVGFKIRSNDTRLSLFLEGLGNVIDNTLAFAGRHGGSLKLHKNEEYLGIWQEEWMDSNDKPFDPNDLDVEAIKEIAEQMSVNPPDELDIDDTLDDPDLEDDWGF